MLTIMIIAMDLLHVARESALVSVWIRCSEGRKSNRGSHIKSKQAPAKIMIRIWMMRRKGKRRLLSLSLSLSLSLTGTPIVHPARLMHVTGSTSRRHWTQPPTTVATIAGHAETLCRRCMNRSRQAMQDQYIQQRAEIHTHTHTLAHWRHWATRPLMLVHWFGCCCCCCRSHCWPVCSGNWPSWPLRTTPVCIWMADLAKYFCRRRCCCRFCRRQDYARIIVCKEEEEVGVSVSVCLLRLSACVGLSVISTIYVNNGQIWVNTMRF